MSVREGSAAARQPFASRWPWSGTGARTLVRADGGLLGALVLVAWLLASGVLWLTPAPACIIGDKTDVGCARGFQMREHDDAADRTFRWTDRTATIVFAGAGYGASRVVALNLAAARPPDMPLPHGAITVGDTTVRFVPSVAPRRYQLLLSPTLFAGDSTRLTLTSDTMLVSDGRDLGVVVYAARMVRLGSVLVAGPLLTLALLSYALSAMLVPWPRLHSGQRQTLYRGGVAVGAMLLVVALWLWRPLEIVPLLPGGAVLTGVSTLALRWLGRREHTFARAARPVVGASVVAVLIGACLVNGLLDWAIMATLAKRLQIPWVILGQTLVTVGVCWWLGRVARTAGFSLTLVLATTLAVRVLALTVRVLMGRVPNDADTELFYNYGRATIELGVPEVEYPSGALVVWATLALPGSRELFLLLVPLLNLACELVVAGGIWWLGALAVRRDTTPTTPVVASYLALCYAVSPLLLPFWHAKFDPVPAALVVLALVAYAAERPWWTGVALGVGGTVKWAPWVAVPFPGWTWLRPAAHAGPRWPSVVRYAAGFSISVAALSLPFAFSNWPMFLAPYRIQGGRQFIGESIWYPIALLFEPELQARRAPPYAGLPSAYLSTTLMTGIQLLALALLGLIQVVRPQQWRRTLALTALAPAAFFLLNRVFSPQYLLIIAACVCAAAAMLLRLRHAVVLVMLITVMEAANVLVWPYTQSYWLWPSIINFAIGVGVVVWLAVVAWRYQSSAMQRSSPTP